MNWTSSVFIFLLTLKAYFELGGCHASEREVLRNTVDELLSKYGADSGPEQIHISLGENANDIIVMWSTKDEVECFIEYGNEPNTLSKVSASQSTMTMHSEQAEKFLHRTELKDLERGTKYSYRIVCGKVKSQIFKFVVPLDDKNHENTFLMVADMGLNSKSLQFLVHEVLNGNYQAVFHIGDIAYNLDSEAGNRGDQYMKRIQLFTSQMPYLTTPGDHEVGFSFYHYRYRFSMPGAPWPMPEEKLWYSINIGRTHFVSINTETFFSNSPSQQIQLEWLKQDLISANKKRNDFPWIIVMGHKPMYCTKSKMVLDCYQEHSQLREKLEDLFFEQGVDLYVSGHKHCYERSWPIYQSKLLQTDTINPKAPIYIIIGAMGYEYFPDKQGSDPYWLAFAMSDREKELYARLKVINASHLIWSAHVAENNEQVDTVHIIQKQHGSFGQRGNSVFEKLEYIHSRADSLSQSNLPPEPFYIIDTPGSLMSKYRKVILYFSVIFLSFVLFLFYRRFRKLLKH